MSPDADQIITAYLNANLAEAVVGRTPSNTVNPWVRLAVLDDPDVSGGIVDKSLECYVQIDCYAGQGGGQAVAKTLSMAVRQLLHATNERAVSAGGGYIYAAEVSFGHAPDQTFEPSMEGYRGVGRVWVRA